MRGSCGPAQVKLTTVQKVAIRLPFQDKQGQHLETVLTRGKVEQMSQPLYRRIREAVDAACWGVRACPDCLPRLHCPTPATDTH